MKQYLACQYIAAQRGEALNMMKDTYSTRKNNTYSCLNFSAVSLQYFISSCGEANFLESIF